MGKKRATKRTHSLPGLHSAMSNWAHTPEVESRASGMTFERNPRAIAIGGTSRTEGDGGGGGNARAVTQLFLKPWKGSHVPRRMEVKRP